MINSDTDYLSIYLDPTFSFYWEHHQLQYKGDNTDYNFVELRNFVRNILTGDSTINLEVLFSNQIDNNSILGFLNDFKYDFINYNIIKSYLGQAKRDLKTFKSKRNFKKLAHSFRGFIFAYQLFYEKDLDVKMDTHYLYGVISDKDVYLGLLNGEEFSVNLKTLISDLRVEVTTAFEKGKLHKMMSVRRLKELDNYVKEVYEKNYKKNNYKTIDYKNILYDVLENGITY